MKYRSLIIILFAFLLAGLTCPPEAPVQSPITPESPTKSDNQIDITASFSVPSNSETNTNSLPISASVPIDAPPATLRFKNRIGERVAAPDGSEIILQKYAVAVVPNDPYANQWWHAQTNTFTSVWQMPTPKKQTLIAIIDTGFALQHEEFAGRLFQNPDETGDTTAESASLLNCGDRGIALDASCNLIDDNVDGIVDNESGVTAYQNPSLKNCTDLAVSLQKSCNRIDDDGNGLIDDVSGWDFVNGDPSAQAGQLNANGTNLRHGSMVMGIAGATGNNAVGTAGIDWNAKLLPLQAIDDDGYGDSLTVGNAILYAANAGADVINLSLGTSNPDTYILNAIEYAYDKGAVVVAAAGNDGCDCMIYPARYAISLSVGATDEAGSKASFSSYGGALDVTAPGTGITSTSFTAANPTNSYGSGSGTSYATPVVSGLVSVLKGQLPTATPSQLIALITEKTNQNSIASTMYKTVEKGYGDISLSQATLRSQTPKIFTQLYKPSATANGGLFKGAASKDTTYFCEQNAIGTTPLYSAVKTNTFYSTNPIDIRLANVNGYTTQQLFSVCMMQPHDTFQSARLLHLAQEFTNINNKTLLAP